MSDDEGHNYDSQLAEVHVLGQYIDSLKAENDLLRRACSAYDEQELFADVSKDRLIDDNLRLYAELDAMRFWLALMAMNAERPRNDTQRDSHDS